MPTLYKKDGEDYVEVEGFLQDDVNKIVKERLERQTRQHETEMGELSELKKFKEDHESTLADLKKENADLATKLASAERDVNRTKVLQEFKLDSALSEFIDGSNIEEMRARAEKLAKNHITGAPAIEKTAIPPKSVSPTAGVVHALFGKAD